MKERRIIPVKSEFQANQLKTLETALYFAQVVEERMKDPDDNRVFIGRENEGITIFPAESELIKIAKGVAKGAYNEAVYPIKTDEHGNQMTSLDKDMQQVAIDIAKKVNGK